MSKSKFSKRQIAGALLLSSTAIGATASGTASADSFMDFMKNTADALWQRTKGVSSAAGNYAVTTMDKGGKILKSGVNKIGDLASNTYNKVAGSKLWKNVGNVAGAVKDKTGSVYNLVKDSKGGQWVSNKADDVYNLVKNSKGSKWAGNVAETVKNKAGDAYNLVKDTKVGNFVSEHAWGVAAIGLLSALTYGIPLFL